MTDDLFGDPPLTFGIPPHQRHSATSRAAAADIAGKAGTLRRKVYDFIENRAAYGATDDEIQVALAMDPSTQRPRRVELVDKRLVVNSRRTRKTRSGKMATVWIAKGTGDASRT